MSDDKSEKLEMEDLEATQIAEDYQRQQKAKTGTKSHDTPGATNDGGGSGVEGGSTGEAGGASYGGGSTGEV